jgi:RNA polymerase sigma-32 factor
MLVFMTERAARDAVGALIRAARRHPMLSREEERALARRAARGDREATQRLVASHLRLVIKIAERYRAPGLARGDLIQEGCIGLIKALQRFNPDHDARLSTYAMRWIKSAIQEHVLRSWSLVRISTSTAQKSLFFNIRRVGAALSEREDALGEGAIGRIARALDQPERDVRRMAERLRVPDRSLDSLGETADGESALDRLPDLSPDPEEMAIASDEGRHRRRLLSAALAQLKERERLIITRRHLSEAAVTLEAMGRELGISKERVRQIESRALAKLKILMGAEAQSGATA